MWTEQTTLQWPAYGPEDPMEHVCNRPPHCLSPHYLGNENEAGCGVAEKGYMRDYLAVRGNRFRVWRKRHGSACDMNRTPAAVRTNIVYSGLAQVKTPRTVPAL